MTNHQGNAKVSMRYYLTPVIMAIIKKTRNKYWQACGEKEILGLLVGMYIGVATVEKKKDRGSSRVKNKTTEMEARWQKSRGTRSPSPTNTKKKKHIYRINDSHRTATNRWQKNLNSNNGKKFVTLLGKIREKRRVREGESELDRHS